MPFNLLHGTNSPAEKNLCSNYNSLCLLITENCWHQQVFEAKWVTDGCLTGCCGMQSPGCTLFRRKILTASSGLTWGWLIGKWFIQSLKEGFGPRAWPGPDSTDNFRVRAGFAPGPTDSNQTFYIPFRVFSVHSFFAKKSVFGIFYARDTVGLQKKILLTWIFPGIFIAAPFRKQFEITRYKPGTW